MINGGCFPVKMSAASEGMDVICSLALAIRLIYAWRVVWLPFTTYFPTEKS